MSIVARMLAVAELMLACLDAFGAGTGHDAYALEAHAAGDVHYFDYVAMLGAGVGADEEGGIVARGAEDFEGVGDGAGVLVD